MAPVRSDKSPALAGVCVDATHAGVCEDATHGRVLCLRGRPTHPLHIESAATQAARSSVEATLDSVTLEHSSSADSIPRQIKISNLNA